MYVCMQAAWRSGNGVGRINEVTYSTSSPVSTGMSDVSGFDSQDQLSLSSFRGR